MLCSREPAVKTLDPIFTGGSREQSITEPHIYLTRSLNIQKLSVPESKASTEISAVVKTLNPTFTGGSQEQSITELPAPVNNTNREQSITEPHTYLTRSLLAFWLS